MNYVRDFVNLPKNWDSDGAEPISRETLEAAFALEELLKQKPWPAPGSDGSIAFEWHNGDDTLIITVKPYLSMQAFDFYVRVLGRDYEKDDITDDS